jgi:ribosomal protein S18 acetylase RimI-like enzyme
MRKQQFKLSFLKILTEWINEQKSDERFLLLYFGEYNTLEDFGIDEHDAQETVHKIAKDNGLNILRDKELKFILIDNKMSKTIGALWTSENSHRFSFDIVITKKYQNKGLSDKLITAAIEEYESQKEAYGDDFKIEVDVINPKLAQILKNKYGFHVVKEINDGRVIMSK